MSGHCRYERDVIVASQTDEWSESLRRHVGGCEDCTAAAAVGPWMARLGSAEVRDRALPPSSAVWLKAQLLGQMSAAERAARPFTVFQWIAYAAVASGWAGVITWKWTAVQAWLLSMTPAHIVRAASGTAPTISITFYAGIAVLTSVTMLLALHTIMAEE